MASNFTTPPPPTPSYALTYPTPHILLITISRPHAMNSLPYASHWEADALITWFDAEPSLRVCIITGSPPTKPGYNPRREAFCAGQDLIESGNLGALEAAGKAPPKPMRVHPVSGFMGLSRRTNGKKPVIGAVNGFAMGGGFEIVLGCDLVVASPYASFALPEASRGLFAAAGGLSKLVRIVGLPVASEVALTGRVLGAEEAKELRVINRVAKTHEGLLGEALDMAKKIENLSPDAVIVSKHGLRMALEEGNVETAALRTDKEYGEKLRKGENIQIGLMAFAQKKKPMWVNSKL